MRILVTGGAGFIGSHVAAAELAAGAEVVVLDDLSTGFQSNVPPGARFVKGSVLDSEPLLSQERFDCVYHLAGQSSGEVSASEPLRDFSVNALGTLALLDWAARGGTRRIVFASSMGVYGEGRPDHRFRESDPRRPISNYGASKAAAEDLCRLYRDRGVDTRVLRLFNIYGPGQDLTNMRQGMLSIYLASLIGTGRIDVKGSLDRTRDFVFIADAVGAMMSAARADEGNFEINISSGEATTVRDAVRVMGEIWDGRWSEARVRVLPPTPHDQQHAVGDPGYAAQVLDWRPQVTLSDGIARMIEAILNCA